MAEQLVIVDGKPVIVGAKKTPAKQVKEKPRKQNTVSFKSSVGWILASFEAGAILFLILIIAGVIH